MKQVQQVVKWREEEGVLDVEELSVRLRRTSALLGGVEITVLPPTQFETWASCMIE